jgi:hypothetical protein
LPDLRYALGRRPTDPSRPVLRMGTYLQAAQLPEHPPTVDYLLRINEWCLGQNDRYGTCGPTSVANLVLLISTWLADAPVRFTDDEIFDLYRRSGNPDFDPVTGADDNGVDMTVMLSELVKGGIGFGDRNVKALAFGALDTSNADEVFAGGALFGGVLWGADLRFVQERQTDEEPPVWDYVRRSGDWGGHAIMAAGRYTDAEGTVADRTALISWAKVIDSTAEFIAHQVPECYVVIFPWHLRDRCFLEGVDLAALAADYETLTGRPFPVDVPPPSPEPPLPSPTPDPEPTPVEPVPADYFDHALVNVFEQWRKAKGL